MAEIKDTFLHPVVPLDFQNNYRVGAYVQRYLDGFREKKILGAKCRQCGKVVVPPRKYCGACNKVLEEFVELSQEGILENFTVGHVTVEKGGRLSQAEAPYVLGMIRLEGAGSTLLAKVNVAPEEVRTGMKVKAIWKDQVEGDYSDLDRFDPV